MKIILYGKSEKVVIKLCTCYIETN